MFDFDIETISYFFIGMFVVFFIDKLTKALDIRHYDKLDLLREIKETNNEILGILKKVTEKDDEGY